MIFSSSLLLFVFLSVTLFHSHRAAHVDDNGKTFGGQCVAPNSYDGEVWLGVMDKSPSTTAKGPKLTKAELFPFCGGYFLNRKWIMTAAHCGTSDPLRAGARGRDLVVIHNQDRIPVAKVYIKKGYSSKLAGFKEDIALIKLSKPATGIKSFACLPKTDTPPYTVSMIANTESVESGK